MDKVYAFMARNTGNLIIFYLICVFGFFGWVIVIYVAVHFISKFW